MVRIRSQFASSTVCVRAKLTNNKDFAEEVLQIQTRLLKRS